MSASDYASQIRSVDDYFAALDDLISQESWDAAEVAAQLMSLHGPHSSHTFLYLNNFGSRRDRPFLQSDPFDQLVVLHLQVLFHIKHSLNYESAYHVHAQMMQTFNKEVLQKIKEENWFMPIFYVLCSDIRNIAKMADELTEKIEEGEANSNYEDCAKYIMESYRTCVTDQRAGASKKIAILNMTNNLFRIYFKINKLNLLKPLIRSIDNCGELYDEFSMADKVTYKYFLGRKAMFDSDLPLAEKSLTYAFRNCPPESGRNKKLVLIYLVPVKMFLGHMPSPHLLRKYQLDEFIQVVEAVKTGNLSLLDKALAEHESFFIQCGIFLMLEKLRTITFRTLFKKVSLLIGGNQIPLDAFLVVLRKLDVEDIDKDELECILANLIAQIDICPLQNKIKGYLSHQHQKLVVSKVSAFPPLSSV